MKRKLLMKWYINWFPVESIPLEVATAMVRAVHTPSDIHLKKYFYVIYKQTVLKRIQRFFCQLPSPLLLLWDFFGSHHFWKDISYTNTHALLLLICAVYFSSCTARYDFAGQESDHCNTFRRWSLAFQLLGCRNSTLILHKVLVNYSNTGFFGRVST